MRCRRIGSVVVATAFAALAAVSAAHADGLPVLGIDVGGVGVAAPAGGSRYVTMPAARNTVVAQISTTTGKVVRSRFVPGTFTIPAVAYDGSASGLSHDGRTLVLIEPRKSFPRAHTKLLVLSTQYLRSVRVVSLDGDFSFDAISRTGSWIYLIQYVSPNDPTRYFVRAFDVRSGTLAAETVVDPRAPAEKMRGNPLSRAMSADGRWAYTLYDGAGATPFVHALDTSTRTARCIDLDALAGSPDLWKLRLRFDPRAHELNVMRGRAPVVNIDLSTLKPTGGPTSGTSVFSFATKHVLVVTLGVGCAFVAALSLLWFRSRRDRPPAEQKARGRVRPAVRAPQRAESSAGARPATARLLSPRRRQE